MAKARAKFGLPELSWHPYAKAAQEGKTFWIRAGGKYLAYTRDPSKDK
jgi:hypothetical protein